jgi:hypothetical protein
MTSNDFSSSQGQQDNSSKSGVNEDTISTEKIQIERKSFIMTLKENARGRFLRITEDVNGRRDTIIVPAPGLKEFSELLAKMTKTSEQTPPPKEL